MSELTPRDWLIATEQAHIQCRAAWLWPDDHTVRLAAHDACALLHVDYVDQVAAIMEHQGASADTARRELAERFRRAADRIFAIHGNEPASAIPDVIPDWMSD